MLKINICGYCHSYEPYRNINVQYIVHYYYSEKILLIIYTVIKAFHICTNIMKIKYDKYFMNKNV